MSLIWLLLKESWPIAIASVVMGLVSGGSAAGLIAIVNFTLTNTQLAQSLLAFAFISLCLVQFIARFFSQVLLSRLGNNVSYKLRMILSKRILASSLSHLESVGSPKLMASLTEDIGSISGTIIIIPFVCGNIAIIIGCLIYLGILSWQFLLILLAALFLGIIIIQFLQFKGLSAFQAARKVQDRLFGHYKSLTEGIKELKLNRDRRQAFLNEDLNLTAVALRDKQIGAERFFAAGASWGNLTIFIVVGGFLFILPRVQNISIALLSSYILTFIYVANYLGSIIDIFPNIARGKVALDKIDRLGLQLEENAENQTKKTNNLNLNWQRLELKDVTHTYQTDTEDNAFILGEIDLTFKAGELIFIVGGNGSGKSTLAKLITGLYIPEAGNIYLDEREINDSNREEYRNLFSVIFGDFYLFDRLLGFKNIDDRVEQYLQKLQLDRKLKIENGKLSTIDLSQGQRKRLALLTAYLEDRPIYLFDEWASDQDPQFKNIFYQELLPELKENGKTIFVISHDDRYFEIADRIIKLDYGKVIEDKYLEKFDRL